MDNLFDNNSVTFDSLNDEEKAEVLENMGCSFWNRDGYIRAYMHYGLLIYLFGLGRDFDIDVRVYDFLRAVNLESDELKFAHFLANCEVYYSFNTHKWTIVECSTEKYRVYGSFIINKLKEESDSEAKKLVYNRIPENVMERFARGDYI